MKTVVYMSGTRWDSLPGTDKMLALSLAKAHHVLWVDHPVPLTRYHDVRARLLQSLRGQTEEVEPGISRLRIPALPGVSKPIVRYSTGIITARCVRTAVAWTDWPVEGVINASPIMKFPSGPCGVRLLHVTDDWFAGSTLMGFSPVFLRQILLSNLAMADAITAVSEGLAEKVSVLAGKSVGVLANGCTPLDTAPGLVRRPLVALVGQLNERLDLDVLDAVAATEVPLLVIGPRTEGDPVFRSRLDAFLARPNIDWRGPMKSTDVATLLETVSVGITPYADTEFNRSSFPLKTLDYLAAGVPVVATDLPATRWIGSPAIRLANSPSQFAAAVLDTLRRPMTTKRQQEIADTARTHSWDARSSQVVRLLQDQQILQTDAIRPQTITTPGNDHPQGVDHVFLTRFNLPSAGFESMVRAKQGWLQDRVELFERFCLPSLRAQTRQNFKWIVYFDPQSPRWLTDWIAKVNVDGVFTVLFREEVPAHELITDLKQVTGATNATLLTTNLDNDDGLAIDFAARVQDTVCTELPSAVYLSHGLIRSSNAVYLRHDPRNAFCSVKSSWTDPTTCWSAWHDRLGETMAAVDTGGSPAWMQVIHGNNVSNRIRGRLVDPAPFQANFPGLLTGITPLRRRDFVLDLLFRSSTRAVREALRAATKAAIIKVLGTAGIDKIKVFLGHSRRENKRCN